MRKEDDPISKSIILKASELFTDIADIGLTEVIGLLNDDKSDLLKEIPFIKELLTANKIRSLIQTAAYIKKYSAFIGVIREDYSKDPRQIANLEKLYSDDKRYRRLIEYSFIELDRYQSELKAKLLGLLFVKTFKEAVFSREEYNSLLFSIENIHPYNGLQRLKEYFEYESKMRRTEDKKNREYLWGERAKLDYSPLGNTGLLDLPKGGAFAGDFGGARINDFGEKFYINIVKNLSESDLDD